MKYKCIKEWKRWPKGAILMDWEYKPIPPNIKKSHFKEFHTVKGEKKVPVQEAEPIKEVETIGNFEQVVSIESVNEVSVVEDNKPIVETNDTETNSSELTRKKKKYK